MGGQANDRATKHECRERNETCGSKARRLGRKRSIPFHLLSLWDFAFGISKASRMKARETCQCIRFMTGAFGGRNFSGALGAQLRNQNL